MEVLPTTFSYCPRPPGSLAQFAPARRCERVDLERPLQGVQRFASFCFDQRVLAFLSFFTAIVMMVLLGRRAVHHFVDTAITDDSVESSTASYYSAFIHFGALRRIRGVLLPSMVPSCKPVIPQKRHRDRLASRRRRWRHTGTVHDAHFQAFSHSRCEWTLRVVNWRNHA